MSARQVLHSCGGVHPPPGRRGGRDEAVRRERVQVVLLRDSLTADAEGFAGDRVHDAFAGRVAGVVQTNIVLQGDAISLVSVCDWNRSLWRRRIAGFAAGAVLRADRALLNAGISPNTFPRADRAAPVQLGSPPQSGRGARRATPDRRPTETLCEALGRPTETADCEQGQEHACTWAHTDARETWQCLPVRAVPHSVRGLGSVQPRAHRHGGDGREAAVAPGRTPRQFYTILYGRRQPYLTRPGGTTRKTQSRRWRCSLAGPVVRA